VALLAMAVFEVVGRTLFVALRRNQLEGNGAMQLA
jgi:hypothetical protein